MDFSLNSQEKQVLLETARNSIKDRFTGEDSFILPKEGIFKEYCGVFVTIRKAGSLRGCIGQIKGTMPLGAAVREMAKSSAFSDPRFPPLSREEFPDIDLEISVLSPLKKTEDPAEIHTGKHGIYIIRRGRSGVLLPQVARDQGWDRETFLTHTCYKAGLESKCYKDPETEIYIFTAQVFGEKDIRQ